MSIHKDESRVTTYGHGLFAGTVSVSNERFILMFPANHVISSRQEFNYYIHKFNEYLEQYPYKDLDDEIRMETNPD